MNADQIKLLEETLRGRNAVVPVAFIADSPWIPGYCGHTFIDYYACTDVWMADNRKIIRDFPDAVFVPGWWAEYGMCAEPTGFGCPTCFFDGNLPQLRPLTEDLESSGEFFKSVRMPDPKCDGLMPLLLNQMKHSAPALEAEGESNWMVCARGPFTVASHIFTVTQLLMLMMTDMDTADILLCKTTDCVKLWLEAQLEAVGTARAIMVLDDVCGFFGPDDFVSLCMPYLKEVFAAFPEMKHFFHNDNTSDRCYPYLSEMGVDAFNFTHLVPIAEARRLAGKNPVLMGNVPPMMLADGSPEDVYDVTAGMIRQYVAANGSHHGLIVSTGGGLPMGARRECIDAVISAVRDFNATLQHKVL